MANYFELYEIPVTFHPDQALVKIKFYELSRKYHPDRFAQAGGTALAEAQTLAALNNDAYKTLKNADATMAYILKQYDLLQDEEKYALPPTFLMEMMDINEAISDYETNPDNEDAHNMAENSLNEQLEMWENGALLLTTRFDNGEKSNDLLLKIKDQYFRKKYLLRIRERINNFAAR